MIIRQNAISHMACGEVKDTHTVGTSEYMGVVWNCYEPDSASLPETVALEIYDALALKITPCGISSGPWLKVKADLSDEELVLLGEYYVPQHPAEHNWRVRSDRT